MNKENQSIPPLAPGKLRVLPLGGLGEIGMNCMLFEYDDEIIVVDCGLLFSDLENFGIDFIIPDLTYLKERKEKVCSFVITHGHEDHIGALPFALQDGIRAPIYASPFTSLLISERMKEYTLDQALDLRTFQPGEKISFKHFEIETVPVTHSIVDSSALLIKTPVGTVVHTGDFKMDETPFYGEAFDAEPFKKAGAEGVLLLMSDSTNVERGEHTLSEKVILTKFESLFSSAQGLTVVAQFASNVGRMGQVFDLAQKLGKKVALSGRSMETNVRLAMQRGFLTQANSVLVPIHELENYPRKDLIILSTGSQAEPGSALSRKALGEHKNVTLRKGDLVILSSRYIPGNEKDIGKMVNNLFKQGAEVLYESVQDIHVSGHAARPELKKMLEYIKPKFFIPVHGEYRHLFHHAALARETGVPSENVVIVENGDMIEIDSTQCSVIGKIEEPRVLVGGREGSEVSKQILKERRKLAETGVVVSLIVRNEQTRKLIAEPEILSFGVSSETEIEALIEKAVKRAKTIATEHEKDLREAVRIELRRFFKQNTGKKPVVLPIILDL